jgi:ABC-type nickel/cobalt efflux system permease component RcnA
MTPSCCFRFHAENQILLGIVSSQIWTTRVTILVTTFHYKAPKAPFHSEEKNMKKIAMLLVFAFAVLAIPVTTSHAANTLAASHAKDGSAPPLPPH